MKRIFQMINKLWMHVEMRVKYSVKTRRHRKKMTSETKEFGKEVIISLTSFPKRIHLVYKAIRSLLNQDYKPNRIILWLAGEEFPNGENDLPRKLVELKRNGLEIIFVENIKSYKKLVPVLERYGDDIIVTADDDLYYPSWWLSRMIESYREDKSALHCHIVTTVKKDTAGITFYEGFGKSGNGEYSNSFLTLSGAGVLIPPHSLYGDATKKDAFLRLAPTNDDVWLWAMAVKNGTGIRWIKESMPKLFEIIHSQRGISLWEINEGENGLRTQQMLKVIEAYQIQF